MEGVSEEELLYLAGSLEAQSEHPLAKAIVDYTSGEKAEEIKSFAGSVKSAEIQDFRALPGNGLSAVIDGKKGERSAEQEQKRFEFHNL